MAENDGYTRTGNGGLQQFANKLSLLPFIGGPASFVLGMVDTTIETVQMLFQFRFATAATVAVAGTVGNVVNGVGGIADPLGGALWWGARAGTAAVTGRTIGTHARALTENIIGGVTRPLGVQPVVLRSHAAGIGGMNGGFQSQRPGQFATMVSNQRGRNAGQDWRSHIDAQRAEAAQMGVYRG